MLLFSALGTRTGMEGKFDWLIARRTDKFCTVAEAGRGMRKNWHSALTAKAMEFVVRAVVVGTSPPPWEIGRSSQCWLAERQGNYTWRSCSQCSTAASVVHDARASSGTIVMTDATMCFMFFLPFVESVLESWSIPPSVDPASWFGSSCSRNVKICEYDRVIEELRGEEFGFTPLDLIHFGQACREVERLNASQPRPAIPIILVYAIWPEKFSETVLDRSSERERGKSVIFYFPGRETTVKEVHNWFMCWICTSNCCRFRQTERGLR